MEAGDFHEPEGVIHQIVDCMFLNSGAVLLDGHHLASVGETTVLGRRAIRLDGLPKVSLARQPLPFMNLWLPGAERYEFLLDAEFGILLGYHAFRQNACFARLWLDHILVNQPVPGDRFRLPLPPED